MSSGVGEELLRGLHASPCFANPFSLLLAASGYLFFTKCFRSFLGTTELSPFPMKRALQREQVSRHFMGELQNAVRRVGIWMLDGRDSRIFSGELKRRSIRPEDDEREETSGRRRDRARTCWRPASVARASESYLGLRNSGLQTDREEVALPRASQAHEPWGVVMDWGVGNGTATVVPLSDGGANVYLSSGGGFIGNKSHQATRNAAKDMVAAAAECLPQTHATIAVSSDILKRVLRPMAPL